MWKLEDKANINSNEFELMRETVTNHVALG